MDYGVRGTGPLAVNPVEEAPGAGDGDRRVIVLLLKLHNRGANVGFKSREPVTSIQDFE